MRCDETEQRMKWGTGFDSNRLSRLKIKGGGGGNDTERNGFGLDAKNDAGVASSTRDPFAAGRGLDGRQGGVIGGDGVCLVRIVPAEVPNRGPGPEVHCHWVGGGDGNRFFIVLCVVWVCTETESPVNELTFAKNAWKAEESWCARRGGVRPFCRPGRGKETPGYFRFRQLKTTLECLVVPSTTFKGQKTETIASLEFCVRCSNATNLTKPIQSDAF